MKNPERCAAVRDHEVAFQHKRNRLNLPTGGTKNKSTIQQDARVLQFLKQECQRTDTGAITLEEIFRGLLSVHNRNLSAFADALEMEAD